MALVPLRNFIIFRIGSEALSLLTKAAPGFNGRVTLYIESSLPYIFVKVTCGVARRLPAATMRLIYSTPLCGIYRVEESNLAAWVFETPPKGTLLPFGLYYSSAGFIVSSS